MDGTETRSQILEAERHPRLADRALGRSRRERDLQLLGREGMEGVPGEEGHRLRSEYKDPSWM